MSRAGGDKKNLCMLLELEDGEGAPSTQDYADGAQPMIAGAFTDSFWVTKSFKCGAFGDFFRFFTSSQIFFKTELSWSHDKK